VFSGSKEYHSMKPWKSTVNTAKTAENLHLGEEF
jgi:hypothetical protein